MKKTLLLILLLPMILFSLNCRPQVDVRQAQYLVGYGSLMNSASQRRTSSFLGQETPVWVFGFKRGFYFNPSYRGSNSSFVSLSTTFLAIVRDSIAKLNAIAIKLTKPSAIYAFDRRESSYCRVDVGSSIKAYNSQSLPKGQYWIYVGTKKHFPSKKYPIVQSYVDLFLSGCLRIEQQNKLPGFAAECVRTTSGWSSFWVNDRIYPRRPFIYQPKAFQIDRLLKKEVPLHYSQIRIE